MLSKQQLEKLERIAGEIESDDGKISPFDAGTLRTIIADWRRMKAALEWYADAENYRLQETPIGEDAGGLYRPVPHDEGDRASEALE